MTQQAPSRTSDKAMIRMPDGMRTWIAEEARRNLRSANAQVVWMLQRQIDQMKTAPGSVGALPEASPGQ